MNRGDVVVLVRSGVRTIYAPGVPRPENEPHIEIQVGTVVSIRRTGEIRQIADCDGLREDISKRWSKWYQSERHIIDQNLIDVAAFMAHTRHRTWPHNGATYPPYPYQSLAEVRATLGEFRRQTA